MRETRIAGLDEFLAGAEADQLAFVDEMSFADLLLLRDAYVLTDNDDHWISFPVWSRMRERLTPRVCSEAAQDAWLRESLTPAALARLRADSVQNQLQPLLQAKPDEQQTFLESLDADGLRDLLKLLERVDLAGTHELASRIDALLSE